MRRLLTDYTYYYFGDTPNVRFVDTGNPDKAITISVPGVPSIAIAGTTDSSGLFETSFSIQKGIFSSGLTYNLAAVCNGTTTTLPFRVSYKGYIIGSILDFLLKGFRNVPVYDEVAVLAPSLASGTFTYKDWVYGETPSAFKNNGEDLTLYTDYWVDFNGGIYLKNTLVSGDEITGSYNFRFFGDDDVSAALDFAMSKLNIQPPVSSFTFETAPVEYDSILILAAYSFLLDRVLTDVQFWNPSFPFRDVAGLRQDVTTKLSNARADLSEALGRKTYSHIAPRGFTGYKVSVPIKIDQTNWRYYTIGQLTLQ